MRPAIRICFPVMLLWFACLSPAWGQPSGETYVFDSVSHDFGVLKPGQTGIAVFKVTNTGDAPLVLIDVKVSCNCAKAKWPRKPVLPGETAELTVTYRDRDPGAFYKVIDITTNGTPQIVQLRLKGVVK